MQYKVWELSLSLVPPHYWVTEVEVLPGLGKHEILVQFIELLLRCPLVMCCEADLLR